jgi:hypothetical protein
MRNFSHILAATSFDRLTQSCMAAPWSGTNGMTSVAPMRGCPPECFAMSILALAASHHSRKAASAMALGLPASVSALRLWLSSDEQPIEKPGASRIFMKSLKLSSLAARSPPHAHSLHIDCYYTICAFAQRNANFRCGCSYKFAVHSGRHSVEF